MEHSVKSAGIAHSLLLLLDILANKDDRDGDT